MGDGFRFTAIPCWIKEVLEGSFVNSEDGPSKVVLNNGQKIGRINILGTVTSFVKEVPFRFVVDDSSGQIEVIDFEAERKLNIGDFVRVIGMPKEYLGSKYIILEILKKTDSSWLKLKLKSRKESKDVKELILNFIKEHDFGSGVSFEDIETSVGKESEETISFLLEKGFLFEIKPGYLKVLE